MALALASPCHFLRHFPFEQVWILTFVALTFALLGSAYLQLGSGLVSSADDLMKGSGACAFLACVGGFYLMIFLTLDATACEFFFFVVLG